VIRYRGGEARSTGCPACVCGRIVGLADGRGSCGPSRPRGDEFDIMTDKIVVLELRDTTQERRAGYEIALDQGAFTAFQSWLESRRQRVRAVAASSFECRKATRLVTRLVSKAHPRPGWPPAPG